MLERDRASEITNVVTFSVQNGLLVLNSGSARAVPGQLETIPFKIFLGLPVLRIAIPPDIWT